MASIIVLFAEHAIIGTYFLILQIMILPPIIFFLPDAVVAVIDSTDVFLSTYRLDFDLPEPWASLVSTLASSTAVLAVLLIGFIMYILGSAFTYTEWRILRRYMKKNHRWFNAFVRSAIPDYQNEFDEFASRYNSPDSSRWHRLRGVIIDLILPPISVFQLHKTCSTLLLSYAFSLQQENITNLKNEIIIARMLRSLGAVTLFVLLENLLLSYLTFTSIEHMPDTSLDILVLHIWFTSSILLTVFLFVFGFAASSARSRVWNTVFSMLYIKYSTSQRSE